MSKRRNQTSLRILNLIIPDFDFSIISFLTLFFAFAIGGILKGATGAGAPVVAIPVLAIFF